MAGPAFEQLAAQYNATLAKPAHTARLARRSSRRVPLPARCTWAVALLAACLSPLTHRPVPRCCSARCRFFYRLLSPAGISCYYQELLRRYSRLLTYEVAAPDKSWAPLDTGIINALKAHGVRDTAIDW